MTEELRNQPRQARSEQRVQQILDASRTAYAEHGRDRFSTNQVAEILGCSIGTIYRYFDDRVAIMDAIEPHRDKDGRVVKAVRNVLKRDLTETQKLETIDALVNPKE